MSYKTATVILGAGASHDCQFMEFASAVRHRLPLTDELFNVAWPSRGGDDPKNVYKLADSIGYLYRTKIRNGEKISLEKFLDDLLKSKKDDKSYKRYVMNIRQLIFYMRRIIGDIGDQIREDVKHTAYHNLVNSFCNGTYEKVIFLTTNYDLLLDWALEDILHMKFTDMDSYMDHDDKWSLVKFHGSVNWVKLVDKNMHPAFDDDDIAGSIIGFDPMSSDLNSKAIKIYSKSYDHKWVKDVCLYPVMVLPHALGKRHVCPDSHIKSTASFLNQCEDFWVVGNSLIDEDLTSFLKKEAHSPKRIKIVNKTHQFHDFYERQSLEDRAKECFSGAALETYYDGFSNFALKELR